MPKHPQYRPHLLLLLLGFALAPGPVKAQDLRYAMVTTSEFGGATGRLLGAVPGTSEPAQEITFIKGNSIRKDDGSESSTIMNWESGILTMLNHQDRSYVQMSLEEMAQIAEEAAESLEGESSEMKDAGVDGSKEGAREAEPAYADEEAAQVALDVTVSSDRTGRKRDFSGYSAEQVLLTLEISGEKAPGGDQEDEQSGGLAIITELWLSQDFPEYRMMQEMDGAALNRIKKDDTGKGILGSMEQLLNSDPRMKVAFEKNQETIDELDGVALRTAIHVVGLSGSRPVDRDRVLADSDRSLSDDAADAAKSGAKEAARSAVGQISGRFFGRKKKEDKPPPEPEEPEQSVMLRIISEVSEVEVLELDAALFDPPLDYTLLTQEGSSGPGS